MSWRVNRGWHRAALPLLGQGVFSATTFASGIIVARTATAEQFGWYAIMIVGLAWCCGLQAAAVTTPYTFRRQSFEATEQREYAGAVLVSQLALALLVAVVSGALWAVAAQDDAGTAQRFAPMLSTAGIVAGAWLVRECCRQLAIAHGDFASALELDCSVAALQLGGLSLVALGAEMTAARAFAVLGAAAALPTTIWLLSRRRWFSFTWRALPEHARASWRFGRWIVAGLFVHALAKDVYPLILSALDGAAAVAPFAAALGIAALVNPLVQGASNALRPLFARTYAEGGAAAVNLVVDRCTRVALAWAVAYCAAVLVAGEWLTVAVYGAAYAGSGQIAGVLALGIAFNFVTVPIGLAAFAQGQAKLTFTAVCAAALVTITVGGPLAAGFAAFGAAVALLFANMTESLAKVVAYRRMQRRSVLAPDVAEMSA